MRRDRTFRPLKPSFSAIHTAGLHDLHPIIPPGATLSPNSAISPDKLGKIPGFLGQQGWYGFDWHDFETLPSHLLKWATWKGAGVGVRCRQVCAVDIDVLDPDLADLVELAVTETLGAAPVRVGRWPKRLLMYAVPAGESITARQLHFADSAGRRHLVEILGAHQQFVVAGIHPGTGQPYGWDNWMPVHRLPRVTDFDLALALEWVTQGLALFDVTLQEQRAGGGGRHTGIDQTTLAAADMDLMARLVDTLPNTYPDRDTYIKVGCAIKACFAEDEPRGRQLFQDWAAKWEGGNDPAVVESDWARMHPPFEVGAGWLMELAGETPEGARLAVAAQFGPGGAESPDLPPLADDETVLNREKIAAGKAAARKARPRGKLPPELFDRYVYVESLERFVEAGMGDLLTKSQFRDRHADCGRPGSDDNAATRYIEDMQHRRCVRRVTYRPAQGLLLNEAGATAVNTWVAGPFFAERWAQGAPVRDEDVAPYQALLDHVYPDPAHQAILLDWLAHQLQNPGVKCNWHLVLGSSAHGVGKDSLIEPVIRGLGDHNCPVISAADLQSQWTDYLAGSSLVRVEEMNNFTRREVMDRVKPMLATPPTQLRINAKGTPQYYVPNVVNQIFFTNHLDAIALEDGDRRLTVLWSEAVPLSPARYAAFYRWLEEGGARAVCRWLAQRDLSAFQPKGTAPMTAAKQEMTDAARAPGETWILEQIDREAGIFRRDILSAAEIQAAMDGVHGLRGAVTSRRVAAVLKKHGCVYLGRHRIPGTSGDTGGGQREYLWAIRNGDLYRSVAETGKAAKLFVKQRDGVMEQDMAGEFRDGEAGAGGVTPINRGKG